MLRPRRIDIEGDKDTLLELHSQNNYEVESPWVRAMPFEQYQEWWLSTSRPEEFLSHLRESMKDERTIADIWEDQGSIVAYILVQFEDIPDSHITLAEVGDILVTPAYRRQGIALMILSRVEVLARQRGAHVLRSGTGIENVASQMLHTKAGFQIRRFEYEKLLTDK